MKSWAVLCILAGAYTAYTLIRRDSDTDLGPRTPYSTFNETCYEETSDEASDENSDEISDEISNTDKCNQTGDVIVQLFEWRWKDIAQECRHFLPQHCYTAVQTSPVTEHVVFADRLWTERYRPVSYRIISRSGTERDFRHMVKVCNEHNIKVYPDVVLNHMSERHFRAVGCGRSPVDTWKRDYPRVPYTPADFHESCPILQWNNIRQVRTCELLGRNDLNQTRENVRDRIVEFLNKLIDIGVAGFRVSDAKHIDVDDLAVIYSRVKDLNSTYFPNNSRPFIFHEVSANPTTGRLQEGPDAIQPSDYLGVGAVEDIQFSSKLSQVFSRQKSLSLLNPAGRRLGFLTRKKSVLFIDDHQTQRGLRSNMSFSHLQEKWYKMAVGFMLSWPHSVARVMSSYKFNTTSQGAPYGSAICSGGWVCEHRCPQIYHMVTFRKLVFGSEVSDWWSKGNYQIAFCRKGKGFVAFNLETNIHLNATLQTCLPSGDYCDVISGSKIEVNNTCSGKRVTVGTDGRADILLQHDEEDGILAIHIGAKID